jgi:hypothetical protein
MIKATQVLSEVDATMLLNFPASHAIQVVEDDAEVVALLLSWSVVVG